MPYNEFKEEELGRMGVNSLDDLMELVGIPKDDPEYEYFLYLAKNDPDNCVVELRMRPEFDPRYFAM